MLFLWIYSAGCIATLLRTIIGLIIEYKVRQRTSRVQPWNVTTYNTACSQLLDRCNDYGI